MSLNLRLLEDPGMFPGGFGWEATWKRVCRISPFWQIRQEERDI
jgi:hypothetical protein